MNDKVAQTMAALNLSDAEWDAIPDDKVAQTMAALNLSDAEWDAIPESAQAKIMSAMETREELLEALSALSDDADMIVHNPEEGAYFFCCGAETYALIGKMQHEPGCWYVKLRAAIAKATGAE